MKTILVCATALSMAAFVSPAFAKETQAEMNAVQGLADLRELSVIVTGNLTGTGQDIEGKAFIGGTVSNATINNGDTNGPFQASAYPTLTVGGNVTGTVNVDSHNSSAPGIFGADVGGTAGTIDVNGSNGQINLGKTGATLHATTVKQNVPGLQASIASETTSFVSDLSALSKALAALKTTPGSSYVAVPNSDTFTAVDGGKGYAVIDITGGPSALSSATNFNFNIPKLSNGGYLPTIINISGPVNSSTSYTINANSNDSQIANYVLFNFVNATSVTFGAQVQGSVLAPSAIVSNVTPIQGTLAAMGFKQGGEVHLGTFLGGGTSGGGSTDPARGLEATLATPEPAAWAMMLVGFGLSGAALRRRRVALAA